MNKIGKAQGEEYKENILLTPQAGRVAFGEDAYLSGVSA